MFDLFNIRRVADLEDDLRSLGGIAAQWEKTARTSGRQLAETITQRDALQAKLDKAQVRPRDARGHFVKRVNGADLPA